MPSTPESLGRQLDTVAIDAQVRRLSRAPEPPWLHREVARRLAEHLAPIRLDADALMQWWPRIGGDHEALTKLYPAAQQYWAHPSAAREPLSASTQQRPWWRRWDKHHGPAWQGIDQDAPPKQVPLVWSNMALHAAPEPRVWFAQWNAWLTDGGVAIFSCLGPGTLIELRRLYESLGWAEPAQALVDMHDLGDMLVDCGFSDPVMDQEVITLTWSSGDAMLNELRTLGGNTSSKRAPGLRTPGWRTRLTEAIEGRSNETGRVALGFEVIYGHAFKVRSRPTIAPEVNLSLGDMRAMLKGGRKTALR